MICAPSSVVAVPITVAPLSAQFKCNGAPDAPAGPGYKRYLILQALLSSTFN